MLLSLIATAAESSTHDVLYAAIIGASTAIAAGLIGASVVLRVERRRQEFERGESDRRQALEMKGAARLLDSELWVAEHAIDFYVVQRNELWPDEIAYPDGSVWPELRAVIAVGIDRDGWMTLNVGFLALHDARVWRDVFVKLGYDDTKALPASVTEDFEPPLSDIRKARTALHDLAYPTTVAFGKATRSEPANPETYTDCDCEEQCEPECAEWATNPRLRRARLLQRLARVIRSFFGPGRRP